VKQIDQETKATGRYDLWFELPYTIYHKADYSLGKSFPCIRKDFRDDLHHIWKLTILETTFQNFMCAQRNPTVSDRALPVWNVLA